MDKTVYWIEYPDKDLAVVVMDDGERQEVMTGDPRQRDTPPGNGLLMDFYRRGFTVHAFTSWLEDNDDPEGYQHELRCWRRIQEDMGDGERVYLGPLSGFVHEVAS